MSKPTLAILTSDINLAAEAMEHCLDSLELIILDASRDLIENANEINSGTALIDFRQASTGGHEEAALLRELKQTLKDWNLFVLGGSPCPETLERETVCNAIPMMKASVDWDRLQPELKTLEEPEIDQPIPESLPVKTSNRLESASSPSVLQGITHSFETNSPNLRRMLSDLEIAASHNVTILLIGETGAGKTYLSKLIHEVSPRHQSPFLHVACGALPNDLIESELFGHVKGAFTSAHADKEGKFLAAGQGTILLDEIDVLGLEQQVKLLRVIETGEFEPVGSNQTHTSQARLVVASNLDLEPLVHQGKFRPDLYYRLNMLKFELFPLRERKQDIGPLAKKFIRQFAEKHQIRIDRVEENLMRSLHEYPWPGNVRELEHVIQRAVIYCRDGILSAEHLPAHVLAGKAGPGNDNSVQFQSHVETETRDETLEGQIALTEKELIEQALSKNNQSRTHAAKELGISRVTLYNKMKKYGMETRKASESSLMPVIQPSKN